MIKLSNEIIRFFRGQGFVIVSTIDKDGSLHNSCKDIVSFSPEGEVYLLDLYLAKTRENLQNNPNISIAAVDEHKFKGYCLKGKAKIVAIENLKPHILKEWESIITSRVTTRVIRNIRGEKGHFAHPEAHLPKPTYMIAMEVEEIIDLTPHHLRKQ